MNSGHPFAAVPSAQSYLVTEAWRECLARLDDGLGMREPFLLVTGEAGTGKTSLVLHAAAGWGARANVVFVTNPALSRGELLEEIALRFGASPDAGASKPQVLACIARALADAAARNQVSVLVVEDAHEMATDLLEELRLLANAEAQAKRPFEIALVGPPALEARLTEPALASLRQRVGVRCQLRPLTQKETRQYLHHRVGAAGGDGTSVFPRKACGAVYERTRGVPRAINALAAEAMRQAEKEGVGAVTAEVVHAVAEWLPAIQAEPGAAVAVDDGPDDDSPDEPVAAVDAAVTEAAAPEHPAETAAPPAGSEPAAEEAAPAPDSPPSETTAPAPDSPPRAVTAPAVDSPPNETTTPALDAPVTSTAEAGAGSNTPGGSTTLDGAEASHAPESSDIPHAEPSPAAAIPSDDARVKEWLTRFVGDQGPIRIGSAYQSVEFDFSREFADEETASHEPAPLRANSRRGTSLTTPAPLVAAFALAVLALVVVLVRGSLPSRRPSALASADSASADSLQASQATGHTASTRVKRRSPTGASATDAKARRRARNPAAESTTDGSADSTTRSGSRQFLALQVGTFLTEERANFERDHLAAETKLNAWVIRVSEYDSENYRVVLGSFSTPERADEAAVSLLRRGIVSEARVIPLPPRERRR